MRIWAKLFTGEKMIRSKIFENYLPCTCENYEKTLMNLCDSWDIPTPILLKNNFYHFETFHITRYPAKNFVESVPFDALVLEDATL